MNKLIMLLMVLLVLGMTPMVSATLIMSLDNATANIGDVVVITISSDTGGQNNPYDWGVYLDPTQAGGPTYPGTNAVLENAAILAAAGPLGSTTRYASYEYGDDYEAKKQGGNKPSVGNWSTVEFKGLVAGTYSINLFDYTTNGGTYDVPGTAEDTQTITVIPEPTTIMVLGLGSLLLRRKRCRA